MIRHFHPKGHVSDFEPMAAIYGSYDAEMERDNAFIRTMAAQNGIPCSYLCNVKVEYIKNCPHCNGPSLSVSPPHGKYKLKVHRPVLITSLSYFDYVFWSGVFPCDATETRYTHGSRGGQAFINA